MTKPCTEDCADSCCADVELLNAGDHCECDACTLPPMPRPGLRGRV